jgi:hypothetical protein
MEAIGKEEEEENRGRRVKEEGRSMCLYVCKEVCTDL